MQARVNRTKRWTPTTIITVVVLLGAVVGISSMVTQKPAEPPKPPAATPAAGGANATAMRKKQQEEAIRMRADMNRQEKNIPPVAPPTTVTIDNTYFLHHKPGEQGLKQAEAELKKQQAAYDAYQAKVAQQKKSDDAAKGASTPSDANKK